MILLEKFHPKHFEELKGEPSMAPLLPYLSTEALESLEHASYAYTAIRARDNKVLACAGVSEYWPNRGEAWAVLSRDIGMDFFAVTKVIRKFLDACPIRRIEMGVEVKFKQGHRWARLLGFTMDAPELRAYLPNGKDCALYSRVRG